VTRKWQHILSATSAAFLCACIQGDVDSFINEAEGVKEKSSVIEEATSAFNLAIKSGNLQPSVIGQQFASELVIILTDKKGQALSGETITWLARGPIGGNADVAENSSSTDENGIATMTVTAGSIPGVIMITAAHSSGETISFTLFAEPAESDRKSVRIIAAGFGHAAKVGNKTLLVGESLQLRAALYDVNGNYLEDTPVHWTVSNSTFPASNLSPMSDQSATLTFNPSTIGSTVIQASYNGEDVNVIGKVEFTGNITVTSDQVPATIVISAGNNQSAAVNNELSTLLKFQAKDAFNQPVAGAGITFLATLGGGSIVSANPAITNAQGEVTVTVKLGTSVGENSFRARSNLDASVSADATATALHGPPHDFAFITTPTKGYEGAPFYPTANVQLIDQFGNLVTSAPGNAELSLNTGAGNLTGTTSVALSNGQAVFTGVGNDTSQGAITLSVSWSENAAVSGVSGSFPVDGLPPGACQVNDAQFQTSDGGCKDVNTGLVWSSKSSGTYTWHQAVWDETTAGSSSADINDFGRTNDYDPKAGCSTECDASAIAYCRDRAGADEGGYADWRLPSISEFATVFNNSAATHLHNVTSVNILSSTTNTANALQYAHINLSSGAVGNTVKSTLTPIYCVRGLRTNADRVGVLLSDMKFVENLNIAIAVQLRDSLGNPAAVEGVTLGMSKTSGPGDLLGTLAGNVTNNRGRAMLTGMHFDSIGTMVLEISAAGYQAATPTITVVPSGTFAHECVTNDTTFTTANGGCMHVGSGMVVSMRSPGIMNWHAAIWDADSPAGNSPPRPSDGTRRNEYDGGSSAGGPDLATYNFCHDEVSDGGYTDWVLPTGNELLALSGPTASSYYDFDSATWFWTATSFDSLSAHRLILDTSQYATNGGKTAVSHAVVCIRR